MKKSDIGIYGLGVMGRSLALNFEENGFRVSVFNKPLDGEPDLTADFMTGDGKGKNVVGCYSEADFISSLQTPRVLLLMIKAGQPVDDVTHELIPLLEPGDIIIDGGNSNFKDTNRRVAAAREKNIRFVGMGVSGGEEGARFGPSLMPGGSIEAWEYIKPMLVKVAAKSFGGYPCCAWIGGDGAGHFIKMVHNGIEYADMQIIAEAYHFMQTAYRMSSDDIAAVFEQWNEGALKSYLMEISSKILRTKTDDGTPLVSYILDAAGQKGTGKWTAINALDLGVPVPSIAQAVFLRFSSSLVDLRKSLEEKLAGPSIPKSTADNQAISRLEDAVYASRMLAYAEGFHLISAADQEYGWDINAASVAQIWQGGCIIQSELLKIIHHSFLNNEKFEHLLVSESFNADLQPLLTGWRATAAASITLGIPMPVITSSLVQFDTIRHGKLPANLIQAQRDFFGAHTYERIDKPRGEFYHTEWQ